MRETNATRPTGKRYTGSRTIDGIVVLVDGRPLDARRDLGRFSGSFEWTYEGAGPRQLALALLADHLGDGAEAVRLCEPFMRAVVATLENDWELGAEDIDRALRRLRVGDERDRAVGHPRNRERGASSP
jgi:hypothetical protein